jgi:hypothetical protein
MRPKEQLVLKDSALAKPSSLAEFLKELKKTIPFLPPLHSAASAVAVELPAELTSPVRMALHERGVRNSPFASSAGL